jgi:hypothetical protein
MPDETIKTKEPTDFITGVIHGLGAIPLAVFIYLLFTVAIRQDLSNPLVALNDNNFLLLFFLLPFHIVLAFASGRFAADGALYGFTLGNKINKRTSAMAFGAAFGIFAVFVAELLYAIFLYHYWHFIAPTFIPIWIAGAIGGLSSAFERFKLDENDVEKTYLDRKFIRLIEATEYLPFSKEDYKRGLKDVALRCPACKTVFEYDRRYSFNEARGGGFIPTFSKIVSIKKPYVHTLMLGFLSDYCFCPVCHKKVKMEPMKRIRKRGSYIDEDLGKEFLSTWFHERPKSD